MLFFSDSVFCQYGVILSAERKADGVYEGYLLNNNKNVFISPELKTTVVEGISKSGRPFLIIITFLA